MRTHLFDDKMLRGTTRVVIRDSRGEFIAACNSKIEWRLDVLSVVTKLHKHDEGGFNNYFL